MLIDATGSGINLDATQVVAVAAFLRVINALENLRASSALLQTAVAYDRRNERQATLIERANFELQDAIDVVRGGGLHPNAALDIENAQAALTEALRGRDRADYIHIATEAITSARKRLEN